MRSEELIRPDSVELAESMATGVAAYVHIPFCRRICPYCDFAVTDDRSLERRYVAALLAEIERSEPFAVPLDAVAIGGGTPTSLEPADLGRIVEAISQRQGFSDGAEVSIEANPEDLDQATVEGLAAAGVSRVSLGVQSFDDAVLNDLGRVHDAGQAADATRRALDGFESVNVDLIYGSPAETDASWRQSVTTAIDLGVQHLSTYALTVERGTALSRAVKAGASAPDPDVQAERWETGVTLASDVGLVRYETSNFARPGHAVAYNLITWGQGEYEAFGLGAHRHRHGRRSWNVRRIDRYVERVEAGESPESGHEELIGWDREVERVVIGSRRAAGVADGPATEALFGSGEGARLVDAGVIEHRADRLVVTRPMLTDEVARTVLALDPIDC